jgi:DNA-binding NtrC family response regulator
MAREPSGALVVEANDAVRAQLYEVLESMSIQASSVTTAAEALQLLPLRFAVLFVSADQADGAVQLVDASFALRQPPTIFVTGTEPDPRCVFALARAGAHAYLASPITADEVTAGMRAFDLSAHLLRLVRPLVGNLGIKEIQGYVRRALLLEALARSKGSRRSAAQLLGVTRPAIQKWLRSLAAEEQARREC